MKLLWYVLTLIFGVIGLVAVFRIFEILILVQASCRRRSFSLHS